MLKTLEAVLFILMAISKALEAIFFILVTIQETLELVFFGETAVL